MAPRRNIDRDKVPPEMLAKARDAALAKQARIMAEQELGIGDSDLPVQKGPLTPPPGMEMVMVDLAPYCDRLVIDSKIYMQGHSYELDTRVVAVIKEQMARTWEHQAEIEGKDNQFYLKNRLRNTAMNVNNSIVASPTATPGAVHRHVV